MGAYLSKPKTDKKSQDVENSTLICGASCMQGWRESQEDAHNCILDYDKNVSLFAVYDGHGGAEVAQYAADELPNMVKNKFYESGDYEKALINAYLDFDNSLIEQSVVDKLTSLREDQNGSECDEEDEKDDELDELYEEAEMPIEDIILRYQNNIIAKKNEKEKENPGSSKASPSSLSDVETCGSSSDTTIKDDDKSKNNIANGVDESKLEDNCETAEGSSSIKANGTPNNDEKNGIESEPVPSSETSSECGPSSSKGQNGNKRKSGIARLITDDSEDDDDDDDDDMFVFSHNEESNSEDSDDVNDDDDDDEDEDEDEDDGILFGGEDDEEKAGKDSGCTAVMALLVNNKLYVANAGDSRCVVSIDGQAHDMSKDHKPEDELELKRICTAGGRVSSDGRVNGGLNLSRALGDHNYKKNTDLPNTEQMITALPDVSVLDINPEKNNFLVLACDGIWNSLTSQEVIDFISERINKPDIKLSMICEELFDKCLAPDTLSDGTGCDNMTCIIVKLKSNHKRSHTDEEDNSDEGAECKKFKLDSTESESVH